MRPVVMESPYAGEVELNEEYARACMRDCLMRGEAPFASHLLYTQRGVLRDEVPEERALGMRAGFAWAVLAEVCVVYVDRGITSGMLKGMDLARAHKIPIERRRLGGGDW